MNNEVQEKILKSRRYSVLDGAFSASMIGFGESYFTAFAVFLKASNIQIGLLGSLPNALGSVLQLFSNRLIRLFGSRKRLVSTAALLQALMYIPVALVFFMGTMRVSLLVVFICLYWIFGMILSPAWNSWMGDLTDEKDRGEYFGRRSKITGFSSFAAFLAAGYILQHFGGSETVQYIGFAVIFAMAFISRLTSFYYLTRKFEPSYSFSEKSEFGFIDFIRAASGRNYGRFALYLSLMNFSVYMSAPFFTPYMLRDLSFDYITFTAVSAAAIIVKFLSVPVWGRAVDSFGARKVLALSGYMMPAVPLLWALSPDVYYLLAVQAYSGFIWGGFEIAAFNFIFDTTTPEKRATCVAYYNVVNGAALLLGALSGSLIVRYNEVFWSKYILVMVASCILRYVVSILFLRGLKEVKAVEKIAYHRLFLKVVSTMPTFGLVYGIVPFKGKKKPADKAEVRYKPGPTA